mmetsp:Transcript_110974/g.192147  ORF Transcript_110974/g.192147 Transcript_110974/m.192147 type:complete len:278 (-) Transcript_110974:836-1669(-)
MNTMDAILLAAQVRQSQTLFSTFCLKLMENPKTANVKITKPEPLRERNQYEGNVCGSTISLNEKCDKFVEFVALVVLAVVVLTEFVALVVLTVVGLTAVELTADSLVELPGVKLAAVELSASSSGPLFFAHVCSKHSCALEGLLVIGHRELFALLGCLSNGGVKCLDALLCCGNLFCHCRDAFFCVCDAGLQVSKALFGSLDLVLCLVKLSLTVLLLVIIIGLLCLEQCHHIVNHFDHFLKAIRLTVKSHHDEIYLGAVQGKRTAFLELNECLHFHH